MHYKRLHSQFLLAMLLAAILLAVSCATASRPDPFADAVVDCSQPGFSASTAEPYAGACLVLPPGGDARPCLAQLAAVGASSSGLSRPEIAAAVRCQAERSRLALEAGTGIDLDRAISANALRWIAAERIAYLNCGLTCAPPRPEP